MSNKTKNPEQGGESSNVVDLQEYRRKKNRVEIEFSEGERSTMRIKFRIAYQYYMEEQYSEAIELFRQVKESGSPAASYYYGLCQIKLDQKLFFEGFLDVLGAIVEVAEQDKTYILKDELALLESILEYGKFSGVLSEDFDISVLENSLKEMTYYYGFNQEPFIQYTQRLIRLMQLLETPQS